MSGIQGYALVITGGLFALYTVTAGVDFGAGLLGLAAFLRRNAAAARIAEEVIAPVWEVTNVFLIIFTLALVSLFPGATGEFGDVLLLPVATGLLFLVVRYMAFGLREAFPASHRVLAAVHGIAGWLVPAPLMAFLVVSEGIGMKRAAGLLQLDGGRLLASPLTWALVVAALAGELALGGSLLLGFAVSRGEPAAAACFRRWALTGLAISAGGGAAATWLLARSGLIQPSPWLAPLAILALVALAVSVWLLTVARPRRRPFVTILIAYGAGLAAFGISHLPYLFRPVITVAQALNDPPMLAVLVPTFGFALVGAVPLVAWIYLYVPDRQFSRPES